MIALDSSLDPPLEQVHLSYKTWVQATPLPRERLRTNYMRMRYATFQQIVAKALGCRAGIYVCLPQAAVSHHRRPALTHESEIASIIFFIILQGSEIESFFHVDGLGSHCDASQQKKAESLGSRGGKE